MKAMHYKVLSLFLLISFSLFAFGNSALALKWPGTQWSNEPISIKLARDDSKHVDTAMSFAVYMDGNTTTTKDRTFKVILDNLNCVKKFKYTFDRIDIFGNSINSTTRDCKDNDNEFKVSYDIAGAFYDSQLALTKYMFTIKMNSPPDESSMKFKVQVDEAKHIGFVGSLSYDYTVPIAIDSTDSSVYTDININMNLNCYSTSNETGIIYAYDIDNYADNNARGAQDNNSPGAPYNRKTFDYDGSNNGRGKVLDGYVFKDLYFGLTRKDTGNRMKAIDTSTSASKWAKEVGWDKTDANRYKPLHDATQASNWESSDNFAWLKYTIKRGINYKLTINDLNAQNYLSLMVFPMNEQPPCNNPPKWTISGSASRQRTAFTGQTVSYSHSIENIGPDKNDESIDGDVTGDTGMADDYTSYDIPTDSNVGTKRQTGVGTVPARSIVMNNVGNYCDTLSFTPTSWNSDATTSTSDCVHIIDPDGDVPTTVSYEKGSESISINEADVKVNNGGSCPSTPIRIPFSWSIGGVSSPAGTGFWYGGAYGCNPPTNVIPIPAAIIGQLNQSAPGLSGIKYCLSVNNEQQKCGEILVYEVPFARFYGNDIYATAGDIRFNSTDNPSGTTKRGSVDQYAALAFGTVTIDTSAFRTINPVPPDGLDASGSKAISGKNANQVYTDVTGNLPKTCGEIESGGLNATEDGCYIIKKATSLTPTNNSLPVPDWAKDNGGIPVLGWGDTFGSGVTTYTKKITAVNPTDKMLMIVGDVINLTSAANYTDPAKTGVLLIISEGPIVVDNNVKRIDAILVSKTGIYTCGYAGYGPAAKVGQNQIHSTCRVPLNINGAVSAPTIDFRRGGGSRYLNTSPGDEQQNCNVSKGIQNCADRGNMPNNTGKSAEIINYPAYLYFAKPYLKNQSTPGDTVDAMFVVPPKL